jgi:general stress protein YciG
MARSSKSGKQNRGFASMDETKQREIASKGGKASRGSNKRGSGQSNSGGDLL